MKMSTTSPWAEFEIRYRLAWDVLDPHRLSSSTIAELRKRDNSFWLSPISVWETVLLAEKRRLAVNEGSPEEWLRGVLVRTPIGEAPLNHEIALRGRTLDLDHRDPADRFIAATAIVHDLVLLTAHERLLRCRQLKVVSA